MIDEQTLIDAFRTTSASDVVPVPPLAKIVALAEYEREMGRRRRFTVVVAFASAVLAICAGAVILLAPRAFPLSLSPGVTALIVLAAVEAVWVTGATDGREPGRTTR